MTSPKQIFHRLAGAARNAIAAVSIAARVMAANTWRDSYNPLRGLTMSKAVRLLEEGERGAFADLQWTYRSIEMQDAVLGALVERRTSALQEMDWDIKVRDDVPKEKADIAARQEFALRVSYERIANLKAAIEFLALASFRGFSHLEKIEDADGRVVAFEPVEQWFWVRDGIYGTWQLNEKSTLGTNRGEHVDLDRFLIREVKRPINRVALVHSIRKGLSQKDWDAFVESFGIPAVFVTLPANVPADKVDEYLEMAEAVTGNARGVLPPASTVTTMDGGARGANPFRDHLKYQDEQMVLRGTGGKLTMLAESGSGTLAGSAHSETFEAIARAEAAEISELLQEQFDAEILGAVTPGEVAWAYFEIAANEETDTSQVVEDVSKLKQGGLRVDPGQISEKTGYDVTEEVQGGADGGVQGIATGSQSPAGGSEGQDSGNPARRVESREKGKIRNSEGSGVQRELTGDQVAAIDDAVAGIFEKLREVAEGAILAGIESGVKPVDESTAEGAE